MLQHAPFHPRTHDDRRDFARAWRGRRRGSLRTIRRQCPAARTRAGPAALTAFWRSIANKVSRVDRTEPEMNNVPNIRIPRQPQRRPAMARTVAKIVYGDVLPEPARGELKGWMIATENGFKRVRAGLPEAGVAGDKNRQAAVIVMEAEYNYIRTIGFAEPSGGSAR